MRVALATLFIVGITAIFLDFTGTLHGWFGWMAKIQFLPAVMALNLVVIIGLVVLTLVFGRIYCSVICPLGVMQDVISWLHSRGRKARNRFSYSPARNWWRYSVLALFVAAMVAGIGSVAALLAPYSSYGRMVSSLLEPLYRLINNGVAALAERWDSYAFYEVDVWLKSVPVLVTAVVSFAVIFVLAWRNGRTYCNTVCPVGTVLGFMSRFSLFTIRIDADKCNKCGLCSRRCKAACINGKEHVVDSSRCVVCMDCIGTCHKGAVSYGLRVGTSRQAAGDDGVNLARRNMLTAGVMIAGAAAMKAQKKKVDGGLAVIEEKKIPARQTPIVPPGAVSLDHLTSRCTGCQLCISSCPNGVLRPSDELLTLLHPRSSYERGYCRPECTACSDACPAGAILPIGKDVKASTQIGHAVWVKANCVAVTDGVACGNCERHCPTGAIQMVPLDEADLDSPMVPAVNTERCIGCGACENLCPARPFSAIYVEGHDSHRTL